MRGGGRGVDSGFLPIPEPPWVPTPACAFQACPHTSSVGQLAGRAGGDTEGAGGDHTILEMKVICFQLLARMKYAQWWEGVG